ncbi:MAG: AMP-binding protein, partial [Gemmatimonadaceae bacterium]
MSEQFADWLAASAQSSPDHEALVVGGRRWSYAELDAEASRLARRMASLGVKPDDRVATILHNSAASAILPHAVLRLGATIVPLNNRLSEREFDFQIADSAPAVIIAEAATLQNILHVSRGKPGLQTVSVDDAGAGILGNVSLSKIAESPIQLRLTHASDSVLAIIYTSGTTGSPKGAMLTVGNFHWSAKGSAHRLGAQPGDRWLACLPLFHVGGLSILMRSAIHATTAVVHEHFDAAAVNAAIDGGEATIVSVVPVMLQRMLDARDDKPYPGTLRLVLLGGGPAPR